LIVKIINNTYIKRESEREREWEKEKERERENTIHEWNETLMEAKSEINRDVYR